MSKKTANYVLPLPTIYDPDEAVATKEKRTIRLDNLKKFAIYITFSKLLKELNLVKTVHELTDLPFAGHSLPMNLFSWKEEHCVERRKGDMVWHKTLNTILPTKAIDGKKMLKDFSEMIDFIKRLMELFLNKHPLTPIKEELLDAVEFLAFEEKLRMEISNTEKYYSELADSYVKFLFNFHEQLTTGRTVFTLQTSSVVEDAVEFRYTMKYYETLVEQEELYCRHKENALKERLDRIKQDTQDEMTCFHNKMTIYDDMVDDLEARKAFLSKKFDDDLEDINIKIQKTELKISKLKISRKYYEEQMERYKDELQQYRLKEIEAAEEKERAEAEEALANARQKDAKRKAKNIKLKK